MDPNKQENINYNAQAQQQKPTNNGKIVFGKPYVKITEQPAGKALRFRYECEGRSAGSIPGVNSTPEKKTHPTIEIVGYKGRAIVVVSCVTKDPPFRPHPHNLVGKEGCKKGVCTAEINSETMRVVFSNLGIQCVKKKDIEAALKAREEIRVDPFKTGFAHRLQPSSIDLNAVRLCFQVFPKSDQKGRFTQPLPPVVSDPIYDKKAMSDLVISQNCSSATVLGNTELILLCEKVVKEDISVRFYEERNGQIIWEAFGEFQHTDVHKQTAIAFRTPRYRKIDITEPVKVFIQLRRPSDGVTSESLPFEYVPLDSDPSHLKRKIQRTNGSPMHLLLHQHQNQLQKNHQDGRQLNINCWNTANIATIKTEPRDASPQQHGTYQAPAELATSSQYANNGKPNAPPPMDIRDYNAVSQQVQQEHHNIGLGDKIQFSQASAAGNNNMDNLNNTNTVTMHNRLAPANSIRGPADGTRNAGTGWNITSNNFQHQHNMQQQQQYRQQHQPVNNGVATKNNGVLNNPAVSATNATNGTNVNNSEHGLSNLLNLDSDQLVRINTEDQEMLRLSSEGLQTF